MKSLRNLILGFSLMMTACSLQNLDDTEGVHWEYYLYDSEVVAGVEILEDLAFFADDNATLYALNTGTGTYRWNLTLPNHSIIALYAQGADLFVLASSNSIAYLYKYDPLFALLDSTHPYLILPFIPHPHYITEYSPFTSTHNMILNNSNRVIMVDLDDLSISYNTDLSASANNIVSVIGVGAVSDNEYNDYFAICRDGNILKLGNTLNYTGTSIFTPLSGTFSGSAIGAQDYLFVGTDAGVFKISASSVTIDADDTSLEVLYGQMYWDNDKLYVPSNAFLDAGVARFSSSLGLGQDWFYSSYSTLTYSPVIVDDINGVVAFIDDEGSIQVFSDGDANVAYRILDRYLAGQLFHGNVHIPINNTSDVFIPFENKIISYSLEWAANQQQLF